MRSNQRTSARSHRGDTKTTFNALECALAHTYFDVRGDRIDPLTVKRWYVTDDHRAIYTGSSNLRIDGNTLDDLVRVLEPQLAQFMHEKTGLIGNGFFLIRGGATSDIYTTPDKIARTLILASSRLGAHRVATLFTGWAAGDPMYRIEKATLEGVTVQNTLKLGEVTIATRSVQLPTPRHVRRVAPHLLYEEAEETVGSLRDEVGPAMYKPERESWNVEESPWIQPCLRKWVRTDNGTLWDELCCGASIRVRRQRQSR